MAKIKLVGKFRPFNARKARRLGRIAAKKMNAIGNYPKTIIVRRGHYVDEETHPPLQFYVGTITVDTGFWVERPVVKNFCFKWKELKSCEPVKVPRVRKKIVLKPPQENHNDNC